MNGRVYDYNLGRFLSVDPFIQDPGNSQSMNPYSYIMNNPLSGTDPSGYIAEDEQGNMVVCSGSKDCTSWLKNNGFIGEGKNGNEGIVTKNHDAFEKAEELLGTKDEDGPISGGIENNSMSGVISQTGGTNGVASFRKYASLDDSEILQDLFGSNPETPATEIIVNKAKKVIRKATSDTIIASGLNDVDLVPSRETAHMVGSITSSVLAVGSLGPCSFACLAVANVIDVAMTFDHFNEGNIKDGILTMVPGVGAGLAAKLLKRAIIIPDAKTLKVITSLGISITITTANALTNEEEND
ncbi:MAG: hypothetical protein ACI9N9_002051 [Enterobacterales bacterium]|jgi:hypothetical protein